MPMEPRHEPTTSDTKRAVPGASAARPHAPSGDTPDVPVADATRERTGADGIPLARHKTRRDVRVPRKSLDLTRVRRDGPGGSW
jgi:hypothetical protein